MTKIIRLQMAQLNFTVGNITGNRDKIIAAIKQARDQCDLLVFPELALCGYPPEDLLLRQDFIDTTQQALQAISQHCHGLTVILGYPEQRAGKLYNAAAVLTEGQHLQSYYKQHLPNYGVFDELRYFQAGQQSCIITVADVRVALLICEDLWGEQAIDAAVAQGAELIVSINASPFEISKQQMRRALLQKHAQRHAIPLVYVHNCGGQDEVVFDGASFVVDAQGHIQHQAPAFVSAIQNVTLDLHTQPATYHGSIAPSQTREQLLYNALVLGTRDYVHKNHFQRALIGLSGGIDSALTLCVAVDALGADNVSTVMLPSRHTSQFSLDDAAQLAANLNVDYQSISIEPAFNACLASLQLNADENSISVQNLQARCRGVLLMALSNQSGALVLATSNKSESAVGYSTLYGDMVGAFTVLKDIYKTEVYALARWRNQQQAVIPERIITRAPSAELAPGQVDTDNLPPYEVLDKIIKAFVEDDASVAQLINSGFDANTVKQVIQLIDRNEYKRRQAAPGVKVTARAFGRDRRYPLTSSFLKLS